MLTTLLTALDSWGRNVASTYQQVIGQSGDAHFNRAYKIVILVVTRCELPEETRPSQAMSGSAATARRLPARSAFRREEIARRMACERKDSLTLTLLERGAAIYDRPAPAPSSLRPRVFRECLRMGHGDLLSAPVSPRHPN